MHMFLHAVRLVKCPDLGIPGRKHPFAFVLPVPHEILLFNNLCLTGASALFPTAADRWPVALRPVDESKSFAAITKSMNLHVNVL